MNILIIDDQTNNIKLVAAALENLDKTINCFPNTKDSKEKLSNNIKLMVSENNVTELAKSIKSEILKHNIDLIILDLAFTNDEEKLEDVTRTSGIALMNALIQSDEEYLKYIPFLVYSVMSTEDLAQKIQVNIVHSRKKPAITKRDIQKDFKFNNHEALTILNDQAKRFRILKEKGVFKEFENKCHVLVVCALEEELHYVIQLGQEKWKDEKYTNDDNKVLYKTTFKDKNQKDLNVIAVSENIMGMAEASALTARMIEKFKPKYVVMTGIAAGIDEKEQNFLDVLIPSYIFNWQAGKFKVKKNKISNSDEEILHVFQKDYKSEDTYSFNCNLFYKKNMDKIKQLPKLFLQQEQLLDEENIKEFIDLIKNRSKNELSPFQTIIRMYIDEKEETLLEENLKLIFNDLSPYIYEYGMVSGSAVVADSKIVSDNIEERKVFGIDMEAYGVVHASNKAPERYKPKPIIIKALCDFADEEKNDLYHQMASYVSAEIFYLLFTQYIDFAQGN